METEYYKKLRERFKKLELAFLPSTFSPTGDYPDDSVFEHARAYKVMTHAELEYYFEEIAKSIAKKAFDEWKNNHPTKALVALVAYYPGAFDPIPELAKGNNAQKTLDVRINDALTSYYRYIQSENHGIKEKNILHIFLPLGIQIDEIPPDLLIFANNYGATRGEIAHSTRTQKILQPEDAKKDADEILKYVQQFDELLSTYL